MFFSITKQEKQNYPKHYRMGDFVINTDNGWNIYENSDYVSVYKGYADHAYIDHILEDILKQSKPEFLGNFCVIAYNKVKKTIRIKTDRYRSFPIYVDSSEITNLVKYDTTIWADGIVEVNHDMTTHEIKFDIIGNIDTSPINEIDALNQIQSILDSKVKNFVNYANRTIKVFLSGGVDSLLVYSFLKKHTRNFELITCNHIDYDYFWLLNHDSICQNWAYHQIHHWRERCFLTSGTPGDEFMVRSPTTADLFLKSHGIQIIDLLTQSMWHNCLHYTYFNKPSHLSIFQQPGLVNKSQKEVAYHLCNIIVNDWQHWHLGNTLTWTPLRDLEIFKIMLRLPVDLLVGQIMNSNFSRQLIERNSPGLTQVISDQKNNGNLMKNLISLYGFD